MLSDSARDASAQNPGFRIADRGIPRPVLLDLAAGFLEQLIGNDAEGFGWLLDPVERQDPTIGVVGEQLPDRPGLPGFSPWARDSLGIQSGPDRTVRVPTTGHLKDPAHDGRSVWVDHEHSMAIAAGIQVAKRSCSAAPVGDRLEPLGPTPARVA